MKLSPMTAEQKAAFLKLPVVCPYCGKHGDDGPEEHLTEPELDGNGDYVNPKISYDCNCCRRQFTVMYKIESVEDGVQVCGGCGDVIEPDVDAEHHVDDWWHVACFADHQRERRGKVAPGLAVESRVGSRDWWRDVELLMSLATADSSPEAAALAETLEDAYHRVGHKAACAQRQLSSCACTCRRGELAATLVGIGRSV